MNNTNDARDALLVGAFFVAYGILSWLASGGKLPRLSLPRATHVGLDPNLLQLGKARRDTLMRQEGIATEERDDAGSS